MEAFRNQFSTGYLNSEGNKDIRPTESSIIVAILSAGTVLGALLAAPLGDSIGRRKSLLVSVFVFCIGGIFQVCAEDISMLLVGRYVIAEDWFCWRA
jgi:MFS transporter, SP family, sugar:H+ symporter